MSNKTKSPGTSDEGQLTASRSPYLPPQPAQPPYQPPPSPQSFTGPEIRAQDLERKVTYRVLASGSRLADSEEQKQAQVAAYIHDRYGGTKG